MDGANSGVGLDFRTDRGGQRAGRGSVRPPATSAAPGPLGSVFTMSRFSRSVRSCTISQRSARLEKQRPSSRRGRRRRGAPACDPGHDGCAAPTGPTPILLRSTDRSRRPGRPATAPCLGVIAGAGLFDFDHVDARIGPTARSRTARTARGTDPEPGYRTGRGCGHRHPTPGRPGPGGCTLGPGARLCGSASRFSCPPAAQRDRARDVAPPSGAPSFAANAGEPYGPAWCAV